MNLNKTARSRILARGLTIAGYSRYWFPKGNGKWFGDACGCPDDRCKDGFHHQPDEDCGCLPVTLDQYAESLRSIRAVPMDEPRWVPVTQRLPDDDITVLVACKEGDEPVWLGYHDETGWVSATDGAPIDKLVTHWKPMPEGPHG